MDTPTLRILNILSSSLGEPPSINQLTQRIKTTYGTAYYANTYQKLQKLKKENLFHIENLGNSSSIKLNFHNYLLTDILAEMEIEKKLCFLTTQDALLPLLTELTALTEDYTIKSVTALNPIKNHKLNRLELLFILRKASDHPRICELISQMLKLQNRYNYKINCLILEESDFQSQLSSDEANPLKESLGEKIILYNPYSFWSTIKEAAENTQIKPICASIKPADISDADLIYNLNRFGYKEFGFSIRQGKKFCIEYIITAILLQEDARRTEAIPIILAKTKHNSNVLAFLSQKFDTAGKLLGLLYVLQEIKPTSETQDTIAFLKAFNPEVLPADKESILQKMRLYHAL